MKEKNKKGLKKIILYLFQYYLVFTPILIGICASVYSERIKDSTERFITSIKDFSFMFKLDIWVLLFWISCFLVSFLFVQKAFREKQTDDNKDKVLKLRSHIDFIESSSLLHKKVINRTVSIITSQKELTKEFVDKTLKETLDELIVEVKSFIPKNINVTLNIMLLINLHDNAKKNYRSIFRNNLLFYENGCLSCIDGILYTVPSLHNTNKGFGKKTKSIALPVVLNDSSSPYKNLPGAPSAALYGEDYVADTNKVADREESSEALEDYNRNKIKKYFKKLNIYNSDNIALNKTNILRSFYSLRIGTKKSPIGVINFNFNQADIFETKEELNIFRSSIIPIVDNLGLQLQIYANRFGDEIIKSLTLDSEKNKSPLNNFCSN